MIRECKISIAHRALANNLNNKADAVLGHGGQGRRRDEGLSWEEKNSYKLKTTISI